MPELAQKRRTRLMSAFSNSNRDVHPHLKIGFLPIMPGKICSDAEAYFSVQSKEWRGC